MTKENPFNVAYEQQNSRWTQAQKHLVKSKQLADHGDLQGAQEFRSKAYETEPLLKLVGTPGYERMAKTVRKARARTRAKALGIHLIKG